MGAVPVQITIGCTDPGRLARFWSAALRTSVQFEDPSNDWGAVIDPDGNGPRIVFQRVPEPKSAKSRTHLDLQVGQDALAVELRRIIDLGARVLRNLELDPTTRALADADDLDNTSPTVWRRFILPTPKATSSASSSGHAGRR